VKYKPEIGGEKVISKKKLIATLAPFIIAIILLTATTLHVVNVNSKVTNDYNTLIGDANELVQQYNDLVNNYNELLEAYNGLVASPTSSEIGLYPKIHARIRIWKDGILILDEYHAGTLTKLGMNMTLAKLTGDDTFFNLTQYNLNNTYISIGDKGTLDSDDTVLPGEWNRTAGTVEDEAYDSYNLTCTFYPDTGPYTADCIGINFEDGIGNNALWGYDEFTEVTGIDETFTITVEFKVLIS